MPVNSAIVNSVTYEKSGEPVNAVVKMHIEKTSNKTYLIVNVFDADSGESITPANASADDNDVVITLVSGGLG